MCNWSTTLYHLAIDLRVVQSAQLVTPTPSKTQIIVYPAQFGRKLRGMLQFQTYLKRNQLVISTQFCVKAWQQAKGIAQIPHLKNSCCILPLAPPHLHGTIVSWMNKDALPSHWGTCNAYQDYPDVLGLSIMPSAFQFVAVVAYLVIHDIGRRVKFVLCISSKHKQQAKMLEAKLHNCVTELRQQHNRESTARLTRIQLLSKLWICVTNQQDHVHLQRCQLSLHAE